MSCSDRLCHRSVAARRPGRSDRIRVWTCCSSLLTHAKKNMERKGESAEALRGMFCPKIHAAETNKRMDRRGTQTDGWKPTEPQTNNRRGRRFRSRDAEPSLYSAGSSVGPAVGFELTGYINSFVLSPSLGVRGRPRLWGGFESAGSAFVLTTSFSAFLLEEGENHHLLSNLQPVNGNKTRRIRSNKDRK